MAAAQHAAHVAADAEAAAQAAAVAPTATSILPPYPAGAVGAAIAANIIFRAAEEGRAVRTQPEVLAALTREVRRAKSLPALQAAASKLPQTLLSTGAYRSVSVTSEQSKAAAGGVDMCVELDEVGGFSVNTGVNRTSAGAVEAFSEVVLTNKLGQAETLAVKYGSGTGDFSFASLGSLHDVRALARRLPRRFGAHLQSQSFR